MTPSLNVTATATHEVKLAPEVKARLLTKMKTYAELKAQRDAIDLAMKQTRSEVETVLTYAGETALAIQGYKATIVAPTRERLEPQRLLELGVSLDVLKAATVQTPGTPYLRISVPGGKDDE